MFQALLVVITFGAAKTASVFSEKRRARDDQLGEMGHTLKHTEQWKTVALDLATFAACCVAMGAAGVLTDEMRDKDSEEVFEESINSSQKQVLH